MLPVSHVFTYERFQSGQVFSDAQQSQRVVGHTGQLHTACPTTRTHARYVRNRTTVGMCTSMHTCTLTHTYFVIWRDLIIDDEAGVVIL